MPRSKYLVFNIGKQWKLLFSLPLIYCVSANAHSEVGVAGGLISGLLHPVLGVDHLIAMVAVGLWGAVLGAPAIWALPVTFPAVMALGAVLGVGGVPLPAAEVAIALSALALGVAVLAKVRPPMWGAALLVGFFAVFHGHAHGAEIPSASHPLAYGVGFVVSTGLLHLVGILIGALTRWPGGLMVVQGCGAVIAALGAWFLVGNLGLAA